MAKPVKTRFLRLGIYALPALALLLWLGAEAWLVEIGHPAPCPFKLLTGHPCPTCGSTRAVLRLLHFDLLGALALNPLVTLVFLATPVLVGMHVWLRRRGGEGLGPLFHRHSWKLAVGLVLALLVNWVYLWRAGI